MSDIAVKDFERRDREQTRALSRYPVCVFCRQPIQTELLYEIDDCGQYACEDCMEDRRHNLDDWLSDREMDGGLWDGIL